MPGLELNLSNCEREPIHIPGLVQSHGFLIAADQQLIIRFYSENVPVFIKDIPADIYGKPISFLESYIKNTQPDFITQLINFGKANNSFDEVNPYKTMIGGKSFYLIISASDEYYLLEFEPVTSDLSVDVQKMIGTSLAQMLSDKKLQLLLYNSTIQVKQITGYDRVMIYRFAEDGHGEVVAEAKNSNLDPWLGLHYPASDVPKQARELYKLNLTRLIADVHQISSPILTGHADQHPLDLTFAQLRAVSPVHIQYLKNMGVASSFSISLLYKGDLWGLIACHNYTPKFIDYKARYSAGLIGQVLSSALEFRQDEQNSYLGEIYKNNFNRLCKYLQKSGSIVDSLTGQLYTIMDIVHASGAVLMYANQQITLGITPGDDQITALINWYKETIGERCYFTTNLSAKHAPAKAYKKIASGMALFVLSKELDEYIIWFKPEVLQSLTWAGKPEKLTSKKPGGLNHISPRNSFAEWSETVSGTSQPWSAAEIKSLNLLKEEIDYAINFKAGALRALNQKLQQAYEELDTFSYTISHDLKSPITAIKGYAQLMSVNPIIDDPLQKLLSRIEDRANKMNTLINGVLNYTHVGRQEITLKEIDTAALVQDILSDLEFPDIDKNIKISIGHLPSMHGDRVMIAQVFTNIISNAIKYSRQSNPPMIHIEGTKNTREVCFRISDNGIGIAGKDIPLVFGLFNRMDNVKQIEGNGVGLAIVKRIIDKHNGKVWIESELNKGTTFCFSLLTGH